MRWAALAVAVVAVAGLAGCLDAFKAKPDTAPVHPAKVGYDPSQVTVSGVQKTSLAVPSFDGTNLATIVEVPQTADALSDGSPVRWGVVVFLHGWGEAKEFYEGVGGATGAPLPADPTGMAPNTVDHLAAFAKAGLIAVAYDARGFGQSGGQATVAGPAEMADLDAVIDYVAAHFPTNGFVGIVGESYGGGQAYQALASDARIATVVPMYGWVDLYQGLLPGNVPKAEWAAMLLAIGEAGGKGQLSPMIYDWLQKAAARTDLETVHAQMDARSAKDRLAATTKPLLICQGLQETLFPQADVAWSTAGGFTRAVVVTGGHGGDFAPCWDKALDWMQFFLGGKDTKVASWPALTTVDASGLGDPTVYPAFPQAAWTTQYLRPGNPGSFTDEPANVTFTISQRLASNPLEEPSGVWDLVNQPRNQPPDQFRQDPGGVLFETAPSHGSQVLLGAPVLHLKLANPRTPTPYQVVAELFLVEAAGNKSMLLSRGAHAAIGPTDTVDGALDVRLDWTHATLAPGDRLQLKVDANDQAVYLPLPANYDVDFTGWSSLDLPYFEG